MMSFYGIKLNKVLLVIYYSVIYTIGVQLFLSPSNLISTGITGVAQIIEYYTPFSYSFMYLLLNIPGVILGFSKLGNRFTFYSLCSILTVTICSIFLPAIQITEDLIINCLFAGIAMGYGVGGLLKIGSSSGGTDFLFIYLQRNYNIEYDKVNLLFNGIIIIIAAFMSGIELALYTLLSFYIRNVTINQFFTNNQKLTIWIIDEDVTAISNYINEFIGHGTTLINGEGGYTHNDKQVLMTILTQYEYSILNDNLELIAPSAFINVTETYKVNGNFSVKRNA